MTDFRIAFDSPWWLLLLALLPMLWIWSLRSLAGLGRVRRMVALGLRSALLLLVVLALAELQLVRTSDRLTVIYLLDQSLSIPEAQRRAMIRYVNLSVREQRDRDRQDRSGVIVFGRDAAVEIPPVDETVPLASSIETLLDPDYTDLAGAMKLALALFPHDTARRVVIVTDGNENLGDAASQAQALVDAGVSIDTVPVYIPTQGEVAVEKLTVSSDVRRGQPFDLRVVLNNTAPPNGASVAGKVLIVRRAGELEETIAEQPIELKPGKRVLSLREELEQPDFYTYEARFVPDDPRGDSIPQNNRATAFTHVRGRGHALLIEDWANRGEFDFLVQRLRDENLEVTVQPSDQLFSSLSELQRYDTVILANVPRSSGDETDKVTSFSDDQIEMLVRNTQQMGSGLVMLGGPNSFGAGGWTNTKLEEAMPVDFQIKNAKVVPVGALALIMHAGEMARGNYWQKVVAGEAVKALGGQDYCGLIHWNGNDIWLWKDTDTRLGLAKVGSMRKLMLSRLDRMTPGDMPQFDPAMQMALVEFNKLRDASARHMIIISDGDPSPASNATLQALVQAKVKVSTVAVGSHGTIGSNEMQRIARVTGGKYYVVRNPKALPRIYQREARRVARPLVHEDESGIEPYVKFPHEMIKGVAEDIPPITGFVLTTVKESPLVEVSLVSPYPAGEKNATILASWTYGLGRTVALTTDAGKRWATDWTGWPNYDKLFSQIIRWSMRPVADAGKFTVATDIEDGRGKLVITALDKDDEFLNFLDMSGSVIGPDLKPRDVQVRQVAPGRYVGDFEADDSGSYFVMVSPGPGRAPIRTGVNVSYSDEFRQRDTQVELLKSMSELAPAGGQPGLLIEDPTGRGRVERMVTDQLNPFRHDLRKARSSQDVWHLVLLIGGCLFFFDVFNRRVQLDFSPALAFVAQVRDKLLRRAPAPVATETMSRLQSRKAAIEGQLEQRRASARFEPSADTPPPDIETLSPDAGPAAEPSTRSGQPAAQDLTPDEKQESYTERLLKAKKKVWQDRNEDKDQK